MAYGLFSFLLKKWPINRHHQVPPTVVTMNNTKLYMWLPTDDAGFEFFWLCTTEEYEFYFKSD